MSIKQFSGLWVYLFFIGSFFYWGSPVAAAEEEIVRAKIGMQIISGKQSRLAKSNDRLRVGNFLRLYLVPESESYVYVVSSNDEYAELLNPEGKDKAIKKGVMRIYPSDNDLYRPNGVAKQEFFSIICSPVPLPAITELLIPGKAPRKDWEKLEDRLVQKSRIQLAEQLNKPFSMAGTVRSGGAQDLADDLRVHSGKSLLVKRYRFHVKK